MNVIPFRRRKEGELDEVILRKEEVVIYVDFVLVSMVNSVERWYEEHFQDDRWGTMKKAHAFHTIRFYDPARFKDHNTLRDERVKFLEEVDLYVQMRRDD
jgi:hypothetical protein